MKNKKKHHLTTSELRGIGLVVLGVIAFIYYYGWWFTKTMSIWSAIALVLALTYGLIQLVGNWLLYLATHYRDSTCPCFTENQFTVDVFVTACDEDHALVEQALQACCNLSGEKKVWLLDDGNDPVLADMATRFGAGYFVRSDRHDAKAGNINAALSRTHGDIIVIFDIDHAPKPDFLTETLGCFDNPKVGFVQVMLTFANRSESWISEATAATSLDFYNPTCIGADGLRSATLIGSNALIRRKALESIQGYQPGLAEDLATSISLHAAGWQSVYVAEPLAPGIAPPDLVSWFTQQLKWSRGVFEILLTMFSSKFPQLQPGHQIMYAVRMTYYWIGLFTCAHVLLTIGVLWSGSAAVLTWFEKYLMHLAPLFGMTLLIRQLALQRWKHPSLGMIKWQWKPTVLVFATWPIYTLSWFMAIFRVPLRFQPTPKTFTGLPHPVWVLPQIITTMFLLTGLIFSFITTKTLNVLGFGFALGQIVGQLSLLSDWLRPARIAATPSPSPHSEDEMPVSDRGVEKLDVHGFIAEKSK
jgi:cellulose synthase/poly-beta-1,6-N-acetylglucosamine synthase-like glycosyltransferase